MLECRQFEKAAHRQSRRCETRATTSPTLHSSSRVAGLLFVSFLTVRYDCARRCYHLFPRRLPDRVVRSSQSPPAPPLPPRSHDQPQYSPRSPASTIVATNLSPPQADSSLPRDWPSTLSVLLSVPQATPVCIRCFRAIIGGLADGMPGVLPLYFDAGVCLHSECSHFRPQAQVQHSLSKTICPCARISIASIDRCLFLKLRISRAIAMNRACICLLYTSPSPRDA